MDKRNETVLLYTTEEGGGRVAKGSWIDDADKRRKRER